MLLHINGIFTSFVLNRPSQSMLSHRSRYFYAVSHISNSMELMIYIDTVKPVHAVTFSCPVIISHESHLKGHLSFSLSQKGPFNTVLTVYVYQYYLYNQHVSIITSVVCSRARLEFGSSWFIVFNSFNK